MIRLGAVRAPITDYEPRTSRVRLVAWRRPRGCGNNRGCRPNAGAMRDDAAARMPSVLGRCRAFRLTGALFGANSHACSWTAAFDLHSNPPREAAPPLINASILRNSVAVGKTFLRPIPVPHNERAKYRLSRAAP